MYLFPVQQRLFGDLGWLFSIKAMVVAQVIIATPLVIGVTMSSVRAVDPVARAACAGATPWQATAAALIEARFGVIVGLVAGFGSIISRSARWMLVGGNIDGRTRVLTTAVVLKRGAAIWTWRWHWVSSC